MRLEISLNRKNLKFEKSELYIILKVKMTMKNLPPKTCFLPSFKAIEAMLNMDEVQVRFLDQNLEIPAILTKQPDNGFLLKIYNYMNTNCKESYKVEVLIHNKVFTTDIYLSSGGGKFEKNDAGDLVGNFTTTGHVSALEQATNDQDHIYHRYILQTSRAPSFFYYLDIKPYVWEQWSQLGRFEFTVANKSYVLYECKYDNKTYIIIDSLSLISDYKEFEEVFYSSLLAFGFVSGNYFQEEVFHIQSEMFDFSTIDNISYYTLGQSYLSRGTCNPIYRNPYGYTGDEEIISQVGEQLDVFNPKLFSTLCNKIYSDSNYMTLILLLLETHVTSLALKPAGYSVALERITTIIANENKGLKPIPDKQLAKQITEALQDVLDGFKDDITAIQQSSFDAMKVLDKKIKNINQPTNQDKLTQAFNIYNITLSDSDKKAIKNRNNFLHGRNANDESQVDFQKSQAISLTLNKLLNKLILKHIGYSGYTINHLKHNYPELDESLFEKI